MHVSVRRLLPALGLVLLTACASGDNPMEPGLPIDTPLPASLKVGDLVRVNVNGKAACDSGTFHIARVEAIGDRSLILADTLNPSGGFTTADYQRYAAKFDTLIYPLDEGAFGAPTDIDNNGRVGIIFTRTVNELTDPGQNSYVGGFTFSRDLFPKTSSQPDFACATSNQGEFFYALAPDPNGTINGNRRTTGFVDSATVPVLAHELQHLINASRKIYLNPAATSFEITWLDEGLAHIAEELLFYREAGSAPRANLDSLAIRSRAAVINAFNADMIGNAGRYKSYLASASTSSPYAANDSLATRGAAWDWLRYLADQKVLGVTRSAGAAIELIGPGTVNVPGTATGAEYYATLVSASLSQNVTTLYNLSATNVVAPLPSLSPIGGATMSRTAIAFLGSGSPAPQRDVQFEAQLRARERAMAPTHMAGARQWYRAENSHIEVPQGGRYSRSVAAIASTDSDIWFRLVNNSAVGLANVQAVFGVDLSVAVSDWSASHAVDDVSLLVADQFQQKSWKWRAIYPALRCTGCAAAPYPLTVATMVAGTNYAGSVMSGGSTHFKLAVPAGGTATLTLSSSSGPAGSLRLVIVRTK